jgi:hypothetical protein
VVLTNRPVLLEGRRTQDRRLVGAGRLQDVVGGAINGDRALGGRGRRGIVITEALNNVVLDQRVGGPAIDGKVAVAVGAEASRVGDGPEYVRVVLCTVLYQLTGHFRGSIPFLQQSCPVHPM